MPDTDPSREVLLEFPSELAYELMEQDVVWPYVREERIDLELVPAVVLSVSTAVSTVVTTKLSEGVVDSITRAVRGWLKRRKEGDRPTLRSPKAGAMLVIDTDTTDEEIAAFLRCAHGDQPDPG
jgi:hypothetical protein